ncbi:MAG TPA: glycosyltransferase [Blastocatellia bacterium]|nr:glycosyltransferase [Blastocatellia bacterium]
MKRLERMRTLYLCYFGLREPLVQTQVLPYLRELSSGGVRVSLLTFEPGKRTAWAEGEVEEWSARLQGQGIRWFSLPYHKRPSLPATLYDIAAGARFASRLIRDDKIDVLHARAHIPMAMALLAQRLTDCRLIFDIRGLVADEYADAGVWRENSPVFRAVKRLERAGIRRADQVVVLTERLRDWLIENRKKGSGSIEVIPCCADLSRFVGPGNGKEHVSDRFEVVYAGSATGLYMLGEMGRFFLALKARRPGAFLRILTKSPREEAASTLRRVGLSEDDFWVGAASPEDVPGYLRRARLGISFRKPTFSQIAASPTKIAEYLAAGLPVVSNAGIGDLDGLLKESRVGVVVDSFDSEAYSGAVGEALALAMSAEAKARCVRTAIDNFDLATVGGERYLRVYGRIVTRASGELSPATR